MRERCFWFHELISPLSLQDVFSAEDSSLLEKDCCLLFSGSKLPFYQGIGSRKPHQEPERFHDPNDYEGACTDSMSYEACHSAQHTQVEGFKEWIIHRPIAIP